jgi:hypothetical protein
MPACSAEYLEDELTPVAAVEEDFRASPRAAGAGDCNTLTLPAVEEAEACNLLPYRLTYSRPTTTHLRRDVLAASALLASGTDSYIRRLITLRLMLRLRSR